MNDEKLKVSLCKMMKELYSEKILTDIGGNLSFRSINDENYFWISPSGVKKDTVEPEMLVSVSMEGKVQENVKYPKLTPSVEFPMHNRIYREDEDYKFIIHSHAPLATAVSILKNPPEFPLLTAELSFLVPEIIIVPYKRSGTKELGDAVAEALWDSSVVILENHGVVAISEESFEHAALKTRALEEYLTLYLNATKFNSEIRRFPE